MPPSPFLAGFHCSMLVPPWAQATRPIGTPRLLDHRRGERQAQARPLGPGLVLPRPTAPRGSSGSPEWTGSGESTSQCSGSSACVHLPSMPSSHDLVLRRGDVDQVADALHVRLAGEDPEVADEDRADRLGDGLLDAFLMVHGDRVRAAGRHADELAVDEFTPLEPAAPNPPLAGMAEASTTFASAADSSSSIGIVARPLAWRWKT